MGPPERLNLRWADFEANARLSLRKLRGEREFNDVTVVADCGKQVEANKIVLAGGSSFFHKILKENPHPHPLIYLKGVGYKHLVYLLDFVYTGETSIVEDDLNDFLDVAQDLKVKGLTMPGTSPRVSNPPPLCETSATPAPRQDQVAGMSHQSRPQNITSTCPALHPSQAFAEEASTPAITQPDSVKFDLPHDQVAANVTAPSPSTSNPHSLISAPHHYQVIAEHRAQSSRIPHSSSVKVKPASHEGHFDTDEAAQTLGMQRPKSVMSSHLNNASQNSCGEDHDNTCFVKVEVCDAEHYNVADHGEAYRSHVSIRSLEGNAGNSNYDEGTVLSAEQDQNDYVISKESSNDNDIREVVNVVFKKQMLHDWYEQGEEIDSMILGINKHDKNKILDGANKFADQTKPSKDSDFQCLLCSITFNTSSQLGRHKKSHINENRSETSPQIGSSNMLKKIHAGVKSHKCAECPKTFSRLSHLKQHKITHIGEKSHKCVECPKTFSRLTSLKRHKIIHTGEKPHQCDLCTKSFSLLANLKRHKIIHTGEKPHQCDLCFKSFNQVDNMKLHKMTHTQEKTQCDVCSRWFSRVYYLRKHKRVHSGEKP